MSEAHIYERYQFEEGTPLEIILTSQCEIRVTPGNLTLVPRGYGGFIFTEICQFKGEKVTKLYQKLSEMIVKAHEEAVRDLPF